MPEKIIIAPPRVIFAVDTQSLAADSPDVFPVERRQSFCANHFTDRCKGKAGRSGSLVPGYMIYLVVCHDLALYHETMIVDLISDFTWQIDKFSHLDKTGINCVRLDSLGELFESNSKSELIGRCDQSPTMGTVMMFSSTDKTLLVEWRSWACTSRRSLRTCFDCKGSCVNSQSAGLKALQITRQGRTARYFRPVNHHNNGCKSRFRFCSETERLVSEVLVTSSSTADDDSLGYTGRPDQCEMRNPFLS